jgi:hypothetical protein
VDASHEALTLHSPVAHPRSPWLTLLTRCEVSGRHGVGERESELGADFGSLVLPKKRRLTGTWSTRCKRCRFGHPLTPFATRLDRGSRLVAALHSYKARASSSLLRLCTADTPTASGSCSRPQCSPSYRLRRPITSLGPPPRRPWVRIRSYLDHTFLGGGLALTMTSMAGSGRLRRSAAYSCGGPEVDLRATLLAVDTSCMGPVAPDLSPWKASFPTSPN